MPFMSSLPLACQHPTSSADVVYFSFSTQQVYFYDTSLLLLQLAISHTVDCVHNVVQLCDTQHLHASVTLIQHTHIHAHTCCLCLPVAVLPLPSWLHMAWAHRRL